MISRFHKMSGAGNDFVVLDNRDGSVPVEGRERWIAAVCRRGLSVGADGVLLVEPAQDGGHFRMRYYNSDGGEAETCGNGARCIARFAHNIGAAPEKMRFETMAGPYDAEVFDDGQVEIGMSDPFDLRRGVSLAFDDLPAVEADHLNTGVPHAVVWVDDVDSLDVEQMGRAIRRHEAFAPAGANANFAQIIDRSTLSVRTYERGVEAETLACGTGCVAAAALGALAGRVDPPVAVGTHGGATLTIGFERDGEAFRGVTLRGEARLVYRGELIEPGVDD
jgi:diaminopimelate epimerase